MSSLQPSQWGKSGSNLDAYQQTNTHTTYSSRHTVKCYSTIGRNEILICAIE